MKICIAAFISSLLVGIASMYCLINFEKKLGVVVDVSDVAEPVEVVADEVASEPAYQPAVVIAVEPGQELSSDFGFLLTESKVNDYGMAKMFLDQALVGLDLSKPAGGFIFGEAKLIDNKVIYVGCLPEGDSDALKESLENFGKFGDSAAGLTLKLTGGDLLKLSRKDGYLFVSNDRVALESVPENFETMFSELLEERTLAVRVIGDQIPRFAKDKSWKSFEECYSSPQYLEINKHNSVLLERGKEFIYGFDEIVLSLNIDQQKKAIDFETHITSKDSCWVAKRSEKTETLKPSRFAGFKFKNALLTMNACSNDWQEELGEFRKNLVGIMDSKERPYGGKIMEIAFGRYFKIVDETIESGRTDFGMTTVVRNQQPVVAIGIHVANTDAIKSELEAIKRENNSGEYRFLETNEDGIDFHELIMDNSAGQFDGLDAVYGSQLQVTVGVGEQAFYVGVGSLGFDLLKRCIKQSKDVPTGQPPMRGEINFSELASLLPPELQPMMGPVLKSAKNSDQIRFEVFPVERGFRSSTSIDMGIGRIVNKSIEAVGAVANQKFEEISMGLDAVK